MSTATESTGTVDPAESADAAASATAESVEEPRDCCAPGRAAFLQPAPRQPAEK